MKKKIYTFALLLFVITLLLYFVWAKAANIQKQALKEYLNNELSLILSDLGPFRLFWMLIIEFSPNLLTFKRTFTEDESYWINEEGLTVLKLFKAEAKKMPSRTDVLPSLFFPNNMFSCLEGEKEMNLRDLK